MFFVVFTLIIRDYWLYYLGKLTPAGWNRKVFWLMTDWSRQEAKLWLPPGGTVTDKAKHSGPRLSFAGQTMGRQRRTIGTSGHWLNFTWPRIRQRKWLGKCSKGTGLGLTINVIRKDKSDVLCRQRTSVWSLKVCFKSLDKAFTTPILIVC